MSTYARPTSSVGAAAGRQRAHERVQRATERFRREKAAPPPPALSYATRPRVEPVVPGASDVELPASVVGYLRRDVWVAWGREWLYTGHTDPDLRRAHQRRTPWPMKDL